MMNHPIAPMNSAASAHTLGSVTPSGANKNASTTTTSNSSRRHEERSASWQGPLIE